MFSQSLLAGRARPTRARNGQFESYRQQSCLGHQVDSFEVHIDQIVRLLFLVLQDFGVYDIYA